MGDFSANFHRPESGIHTVEGTISGSRAAYLEKKRQKEQEEFEKRKNQIIVEQKNRSRNIHDKFSEASKASQIEKSFKSQTVGLVSAQDFKLKTKLAEELGNSKDDTPDVSLLSTTTEKLKKEGEEGKDNNSKKNKKKKKKLKEKKKFATLSFNFDEEDGEEEQEIVQEKKKMKLQQQEKEEDIGDELKTTTIKSKKDPTIDTSFLPDKLRDEELNKERIRLQHEWKQKQIAMKTESLEIIYSYWDGSGHRRKVIVKKGDSIGDFLEKVRIDLYQDFREMQKISSGADSLLYVKEDLILPNDITFYDLIAIKARGKSGPLFHFDVHDDIRLGAIDTRIEKDESHPGKVVERRWYDRNKHIFPASRWEVYDPTKNYGKYTIGDKNIKKSV